MKYCYSSSFLNQTKLTGFGYKAPLYPIQVQPKKTQPKVVASTIGDVEDVEVVETLMVQPQDDLPIPGPSKTSHTRSASVLSDPSTDNEHIGSSALADVAEDDQVEVALDDQDGISSGVAQGLGTLEIDEVEIEDGEDELEDGVQGPKDHIRDWADLQSDIKALLKKKSKSLPLSQINQYLIISNFATLCLKGFSRTQASLEIARQWHEGQGTWFAQRVRVLARHFQIFEKLPIEKRGGAANARSWLHDEQVQLKT